MKWNELNTREPERAAEFSEKALGVDVETMDGSAPCTLLKVDGRGVGSGNRRRKLATARRVGISILLPMTSMRRRRSRSRLVAKPCANLSVSRKPEPAWWCFRIQSVPCSRSSRWTRRRADSKNPRAVDPRASPRLPSRRSRRSHSNRIRPPPLLASIAEFRHRPSGSRSFRCDRPRPARSPDRPRHACG